MEFQTSRMSFLGRREPLTSVYSYSSYVPAQRRALPEIELNSSRTDSTITIAALGRSLHLGRLYDCRNDSYITGVTLWDEEELKEHVYPTNKPGSNVQYSNSDSIQQKARLLNVNASLKASFLGGLVEVGGSAKYLNDQKSSTSQSRITMQYIQTTRREELTMKQLSKITYPQVFEDKNATHVVTGVDYGAQAFMVFDKMTSEKEDVKSVEGALEVMVKKMFPVEGKASVNLSNEEKSLAENINCTFYGDFELEENPTTFAEAVQLYKKLPSFLKQDKSKAVPLKVTLYPLASLDSRAARLERYIHESLLNKVESAMEELTTVDMRCQDLLKNKTVNDFPDVKERLQTFQELYSDYKSLFKKELQGLLPAIRSGEENEQELVKILRTHQTSPYRPKMLNQLLENFQIEVDRLHDYIGELSSITSTVTSSERFSSILSKSTVDTVICFSFTSLKDEDPILASLPTIFDDFEKLPSQPKTPTDQIDGLHWFNNPEIISRMNQNILLFKNFCEANKNKPNTMFVIATIPDPSNPGTSIRRYEKCEMVDGSFQPVSKPPLPIVEILDKSVVLKLQKPPTGVPVKFRVEYKASHSDSDAWEFKDTPDAQESFTLTDLEMAHQYWVRYRAVSDVGMSEASDAVPFSLKGTVSVSVGQAWDWKTSSLFNDVRMKIMTSLGISRWNLSTIDSEVTNRLSNVSIPYADTIPGGLRPGMAIYYQGVVDPKATEFVIDLQSAEDIAFHFKLDIKYKSAICDCCRNQRWEGAYYASKAFPLSPGSAFDMFTVIKKEGYEVYINGEKFCNFKHRIPIEKVKTFNIHGKVFINTIGHVNNWSTSTFGKEQSRENSRGRNSNVQFGETYPVCNPSKIFTGPIAGGLKAGQALFFQGVVPTDAKTFTINLMLENREDIAFHFNPRIDNSSVVCDSRQGGWWTRKEEFYVSPFVKGSAFDIFMVVKPENFKVIVNGHFLCEFKHRDPLEKVKDLNISGDVFMNHFGICEVDKIKISVTLPAHKGN